MATPDQIILGYNNAVRGVRSRVEAYAKFAWLSAGSWRDSDVDRLVALIVPKVRAGQVKTAQLTAAYLAALQSTRAGAVVAAVPVARELVTAARGVPSEVVYRRPAATMYSALAKGATLSVAVDQGVNRLMSIVGTDHQLAKREQSRTSARAGGFKYMIRTLTGRENCAMCAIASTQRYRVQDLQPIHPGCVPGDSVLSPVAGGSTHLSDFAWGEVEAVSRRLFEGELIEFTTASGDEVRVTPNHPVLTNKGWIPAHLLSEGDTVFSGGSRERVILSGPDVNKRPAFAEDVFDAARMAFPLVRVPLAAEDFHADAAKGEVEIIYTHGNFPTPGGTDVVERLSERGFVHAHGGRVALDSGGALGTFRVSVLAASSGDMSGGYLGGDLLGGHLGGPVEPSGPTATRFDAPASEFSLESEPIYARQGMNLVSRLSGDVQGDSVVKLRRVSFTGHVFNLHTREGWYSSNNHIISNCDCGSDTLSAGEDPGQVLDPDLLELVHSAVEVKTGEVDRGGRVPDYRELIMVREHGELGPTLTWRSDRFTGPDDIPMAIA